MANRELLICEDVGACVEWSEMWFENDKHSEMP